MAAILNPKFKVVLINKVSTEKFDKANDGYGQYEIIAEVRFSLYSDTGNTQHLTNEAMEKLNHALS